MADSMKQFYPGMDDEEAEPSHTGEAEEREEKEEGETALLPKSFFEGQTLKPGEQYYVEIVRSYEDEVLVRYPHKVKGEEGEAMGTEMGSNPGMGGY